MQAASSPYLPPPPQPYYQGLYHIQPLGSHQDHELKRQYLALLSSQQIIDICLTFDIHVSPYVKSTIWPQDLNAAIAGLRKSTVSATNDDERGGGDSLRKDGNDSTTQEPIMASLDRLTEGSGGHVHGERMEERGTEKQLKESVSGTSTATAPTGGSTQASATSTSSTVAPASTPAAPVPTSSTPAPPPAPQQQQQPPYPHQPYGYPQHSTAAYPHAPYYPPPPGYPSYPPSSYPHYPLPNGYPTAPGSYPLPSNPYSTPPPPPTHQQSSSLHYPHLHPHPHQDQTPDDLPSYEEMIVEALQESVTTDLEGCAPKDLFSWMAARYPLQSNFRPSASQALQKAFKRGRLEKSSSGKYRLNGTWEGGSTSRRTTRRPQSQSTAPPPPPLSSSSASHLQPPPSGSPFTHAPLVHHHHHHHDANSQQQHNAHNSGYPYAYGYPGYPQHPAQQQQQQQPTSSTDISVTKSTTGDKTTTTGTTATSDDPDRDAYEAAQNILKAINFGNLLQIAQNEDGNNHNSKKSTSSLLGGDGGGEVSMDQLTSLLMQAQHAISSQQQSMEGQQQQQQQQQQQVMVGAGPNSTLASVATPLPTLSATAGVAVASTSTTSSHVTGLTVVNVRAELQAQLALLAVQLAELGQESENGGGGGGNGVVGQLLYSQNGMVGGSRSEDVGRRERDGDGGLVMVVNSEGPSSSSPPPPMNGLLPLSHNSDSVSKTITSSESQKSSSMNQLQRLQGRQEDGDDDIPIDPVLRDACVVPVVGDSTSSVTSPITTTMVTKTTSTLPMTDESVQNLPPVSERITGSGPTVSSTTVEASVSVLSVDQGEEEGRLGNGVPSLMIGGGDGDEDDSDGEMEEII